MGGAGDGEGGQRHQQHVYGTRLRPGHTIEVNLNPKPQILNPKPVLRFDPKRTNQVHITTDIWTQREREHA